MVHRTKAIPKLMTGLRFSALYENMEIRPIRMYILI